MLVSQTLIRNNKIKNSNIRKMLLFINISESRIVEQGCGCFIPNRGVAHHNQSNKTFDAIGVHIKRNINPYFDGLISEEKQKPMVRQLVKLYGIHVERDTERSKFINFLQDIQDAHDTSFDEFDQNVKNSTSELKMNIFRKRCNEIRKEYRLSK